jgi:penicillin-binding protein 1A
MMQLVVTEGTGKRAMLDFTHAVGKTGTSSSYRDAWFMGFTGRYVTGVWIGNDDFRPMRNVTGGSLPAATWHAYMSVAHTNMNIPTIPGLQTHPTQVAEQQRLAELRRTDPRAAKALEASQNNRSTSLMSDQTKDVLRKLAVELRRAGGLEAAPAAPGDPGPIGPPAPPPERRAEAVVPPPAPRPAPLR